MSTSLTLCSGVTRAITPMSSTLFSTACSIPEMWPTSVAIPVAVTTNSPEPRVTLVFM